MFLKGRFLFFLCCFFPGFFLRTHQDNPQRGKARRKHEHGYFGKPRYEHGTPQGPCSNKKGPGLRTKLCTHFSSQIFLGNRSCHNDTGCCCYKKRGYLRNKTVTDTEKGVCLHGNIEAFAPHYHADYKTANYINEGDDNAHLDITLYKFRRTIHGSVKISFLADLFPAGPRLVFIDQSIGKVRIYAHLLARHSVQSKTCGNFSCPRGALCDNDKLDSDQNDKDDEADNIIASHHETAESPYYFPVKGRAIEKYEPC